MMWVVEQELLALRIGELSIRTGVRVPTLRAWESRYRLLRPSRTAGGHRLYGGDDQARIHAVLRLMAEGIAVGDAARWVAGREPAAVSSPAPGLGRHGQMTGDSGVAVMAVSHSGRLSADRSEADLPSVIYDTTRAILHAVTPTDVVSVLAAFTRQIGASLVDAQIDDAVLPVDLSFGEGPPMLPRAEPMSVARMALEQALPALVEDARRVIHLLRRAEPLGPSTT